MQDVVIGVKVWDTLGFGSFERWNVGSYALGAAGTEGGRENGSDGFGRAFCEADVMCQESLFLLFLTMMQDVVIGSSKRVA